MYVWEHGVTAGIGNERYAITREKSGRGGSDKVHTKGRDLDPWTTLPTVEYRRIICVVRYEEKLPSIKEPRTEDLLSRFFFFLILSGSGQGDGNYAASVHASFANKKQRLRLKG